jgi:hypothetical protein
MSDAYPVPSGMGWLWAAYLVATHHPGISAKQLQRQLGLSRYETAWLILQKLRRAMVAPKHSLLTGVVEIDEFWLGGYLPVYLDEFVFRHNRRGTPMAAFQTLLGLGAIHDPTTYGEITSLRHAA